MVIRLFFLLAELVYFGKLSNLLCTLFPLYEEIVLKYYLHINSRTKIAHRSLEILNLKNEFK